MREGEKEDELKYSQRPDDKTREGVSDHFVRNTSTRINRRFFDHVISARFSFKREYDVSNQAPWHLKSFMRL